MKNYELVKMTNSITPQRPKSQRSAKGRPPFRTTLDFESRFFVVFGRLLVFLLLGGLWAPKVDFGLPRGIPGLSGGSLFGALLGPPFRKALF